jgi:hypothetical protein
MTCSIGCNPVAGRFALACGVAAMFSGLAATPASGAPVAIGSTSAAVSSSEFGLSSNGIALLGVRDGVIAISVADRGLIALTFESSASQELDAGGSGAQLVVTGPAAARGRRLAALDVAGEALVEQGVVDDPLTPVVRLYLVTSDSGTTSFAEQGIGVFPDDEMTTVRRFGSGIAIGGNAIAVVSETTQGSDRIDIFTVSPDGAIDWSQTFLPGTLDTKMAISSSGATIAASGVRRLAASGEVQIHRIGPAGWVPTQRFLRIGGGAVIIDNEQVFVQKNSFFARPDGPWTVLGASPGQPYVVVAELPVEGDSLAAEGDIVAVGDSANDVVYLLGRNGGGDAPYRFSHAVRPPGASAGAERPRFGTAVALGAGLLTVGAPGPSALTPGGEIHRFSIVDGPVGCTVVGTDGPDRLAAVPESANRGQILCGLGGNDILTGIGAADRLFGGEGDDQLTAGSDGGLLNGGPGVDTCAQTAPVTGEGLLVLVACE